MRAQILNAIFERMAKNPDIFFLNADMGINLVEKFSEAYPDRYLNVGIAEQNAIGVSAGLANLGYKPFVYTISNFLIHRCFEQIRNDIALHDYPITLIGTSTGFDNAPLGPTHHIIDDWGGLKSLRGIDIYCPSSVSYALQLVDHIVQKGRPAYIRVPKGEFLEPDSPEHLVKISGTSDDVILVSYGSPAQLCLNIHRHNPRVSVLIVNQLHPLDYDALRNALEGHRKIIVVEDHFGSTGLFSALCEFVALQRLGVLIESVAPKSYYFDVGQSSDYFFERCSMDLSSLNKIIKF